MSIAYFRHYTKDLAQIWFGEKAMGRLVAFTRTRHIIFIKKFHLFSVTVAFLISQAAFGTVSKEIDLDRDVAAPEEYLVRLEITDCRGPTNILKQIELLPNNTGMNLYRLKEDWTTSLRTYYGKVRLLEVWNNGFKRDRYRGMFGSQLKEKDPSTMIVETSNSRSYAVVGNELIDWMGNDHDPIRYYLPGFSDLGPQAKFEVSTIHLRLIDQNISGDIQVWFITDPKSEFNKTILFTSKYMLIFDGRVDNSGKGELLIGELSINGKTYSGKMLQKIDEKFAQANPQIVLSDSPYRRGGPVASDIDLSAHQEDFNTKDVVVGLKTSRARSVTDNEKRIAELEAKVHDTSNKDFFRAQSELDELRKHNCELIIASPTNVVHFRRK